MFWVPRNRSPKQGVKELSAAGFLETRPEAVALFIRKHEAALDKTQARLPACRLPVRVPTLHPLMHVCTLFFDTLVVSALLCTAHSHRCDGTQQHTIALYVGTFRAERKTALRMDPQQPNPPLQ